MSTPRAPKGAVTVVEAAKQLRRHPSTIRRWIADKDAPTVRLGRGARGRGSTVDPDALAAWYAVQHLGAIARRDEHDHLDRLAVLLLDFLKRDCGIGIQAHLVVDIREPDAAAYLALLFRYVFLRLRERLPQDAELPEPVKRLLDNARTDASD